MMAAIDVSVQKDCWRTILGDEPVGLELLLNLSYRVWISPFRVAKEICGRKELKVTRTREVVCLLLHVSVVLHQAFAYAYALRNNLRDGDPKFIFNLALRATSYCFILSVIHTLWYGRDILKKFMNGSLPKTRIGKRLPNPWWLNWLLILASLGTLLSNVAFVCFPNPKQQGEFRRILDEFGCVGTPAIVNQTSDARNVWVDLFTEAECISRKVAVVLLFFLRVNTYVIGVFGCLMQLMNSAELYRIAMDLCNYAAGVNGDKYGLMREYGKGRRNIALLNKAASLSLLFNATQAVMFASLELPGMMEADTPSVLLALVWIRMATTIGMYLLAADANWKMRQVKSEIVSRFPLTQSANVATTLANLPGEDGLTGGKFFILSYEFLGSVMTVIFTYVLVVQQLKIP